MVKNVPANAGDSRDMSSNPGSGRFPGEENGNPYQYSCLGNPMDRGAWQATVHGVSRVGHDLVTKQQSSLRVNKEKIPEEYPGVSYRLWQKEN